MFIRNKPDDFWISLGCVQAYVLLFLWITPKEFFAITVIFLFFLELLSLAILLSLRKKWKNQAIYVVNETDFCSFDGSKKIEVGDIKNVTLLDAFLFVLDSNDKAHLFFCENKSKLELKRCLKNQRLDGKINELSSWRKTIVAYFSYYRSVFLTVVLMLLPLAAGDSRGVYLIIASSAGRDSAVEALLKLGTNVNYEVRDTWPLMAAVRANRPSSVALLLKYGADAKKTDLRGQSVLSISKKRHFVELENLLSHAVIKE